MPHVHRQANHLHSCIGHKPTAPQTRIPMILILEFSLVKVDILNFSIWRAFSPREVQVLLILLCYEGSVHPRIWCSLKRQNLLQFRENTIIGPLFVNLYSQFHFFDQEIIPRLWGFPSALCHNNRVRRKPASEDRTWRYGNPVPMPWPSYPYFSLVLLLKVLLPNSCFNLCLVRPFTGPMSYLLHTMCISV